ncbi:MAG: 2-C-methyl-D-erythritol 4-phosphate cytidylyltransferase [Zoogloeaceae bacterium]|nr:2-C-methyl-D-erythritol 4-phosphate cytidylyltransferase [Zoogloeaceae bacterium]MCK6384261.1 2-C-methyl-D-erythritol 4-phosphate cytidylyltransferase [Rhodocyclaceae bacterium]
MPRYFALIPAAGTGSRVGGERSKQYQLLAGQPMMRHALAVFCASPRIQRVFVVLAEADGMWERFHWSALGPQLAVLRCGGATRADSVLNGLQAISAFVEPDDWILVHDAARPCLSSGQLDELVDRVGDDAVGGILAIPVADTLKRGTPDRRIEATLPREHLWQAQTPQMFRYGLLREALSRSRAVTDEAAAVEALGHHPLLVPSDPDNLKVTWPADLALAERILQQRKQA